MSGGDGLRERLLDAIDKARAAEEKAFAEVVGLCDGSRRWTMCVPVQPESDSDVVITAALTALRNLCDIAAEAAESDDERQQTVRELQAVLDKFGLTLAVRQKAKVPEDESWLSLDKFREMAAPAPADTEGA